MGGATSNADGSAGEASLANVCKGRQKYTNDLAGCVHYVLQRLMAGGSAASIPHSDAARINSLNGAPIEGVHDGR